MNNLRLLTGLLCVALSGSSLVCCYGQAVVTLDEIFESAEANSAQLRFYLSAQNEAEREIAVARSALMPDINASLSLSYIGDGFALRKWRYKTMTFIGFALATVYLVYFYFMTDYGVEKEMLFIPLFFRGAASVMISIIFLTSIVQSGLPFMVFPQALTINGFTGAVLGVTLGPALVGELFRHIMAKNAALLGAAMTDYNQLAASMPFDRLYGLVNTQAAVVSIKEVYGWMLIAALVSLLLIAISYSPVRPFAIFPKWSTVRRMLRHVVRTEE